jgi:hypothetical protein
MLTSRTVSQPVRSLSSTKPCVLYAALVDKRIQVTEVFDRLLDDVSAWAGSAGMSTAMRIRSRADVGDLTGKPGS